MNNFHGRYKQRGCGTNDPAIGRLLRAGRNEERQRINRAENFALNRGIAESSDKQATKKKLTPELNVRLRRWKLEKKLKKEKEQLKKKPVFKVGVVHHHYYSPVASNRFNSQNIPCHGKGANKTKIESTPPKKITRATQKRLEAKKIKATPAGPLIPQASTSRTKSQRKRLPSAEELVNMSFAPENYTFKGPAEIKGMPLFGRFAIDRDSVLGKDNSAEELKGYMEQPWPSPRSMQKVLVRQMAVDNSSMTTDNKNSSPTRDSEAEPDDTRITDDNPTSKVDEYHREETLEVTDFSTPSRSDSPVPATFSPYVTTSRGKESARKERRSKMGIGRATPPEEIPTKDTVMQILNISVEEEERTAQYFKFILQREIDRLEEMCVKWEKIKTEPDVTEDAGNLICQAIGQTRLLVRKKFERFRGLVLDCETGKGEMLVQCRDLQGFWDMVYMEVKNCETRFQKLEALRSKNWIEDEIIEKKKGTMRKKTGPAKVKISAKSSARSWILARKKAMSQTEEEPSDNVLFTDDGPKASKPSKSGTTMEKTPRDTGSRRSARKSPQTVPQTAKRLSLKATPKKTPGSLLKRVQLSEATKNMRSPLAVMKISKMCKTPEVRLDDTISYVNSDQTPGKGILKRSEESSTTDSAITKSVRKVDFNEDVGLDEAPINENLENSIDLGRALARIDSYDSDELSEPIEALPPSNVTLRRVKKSLDFVNESFNETENTDTAESATVVAATPEVFVLPVIKITQPTPSSKSTLQFSRPSRRRTSNVAESTAEESEADEANVSVTRVLRNRTVTANTPSRKSRRSTKSSMGTKFIDLESSTKENNDPQVEEREISELESSKIVGTERGNDYHTNRRRSTRKSVRFNAEDCSACTDSTKPVHPMTPHTYRSRKISLLGENSRESIIPLSSGDLMSFDSPSVAVVPPRVRRASEMTRKSSH